MSALKASKACGLLCCIDAGANVKSANSSAGTPPLCHMQRFYPCSARTGDQRCAVPPELTSPRTRREEGHATSLHPTGAQSHCHCEIQSHFETVAPSLHLVTLLRLLMCLRPPARVLSHHLRPVGPSCKEGKHAQIWVMRIFATVNAVLVSASAM